MIVCLSLLRMLCDSSQMLKLSDVSIWSECAYGVWWFFCLWNRSLSQELIILCKRGNPKPWCGWAVKDPYIAIRPHSSFRSPGLGSVAGYFKETCTPGSVRGPAEKCMHSWLRGSWGAATAAQECSLDVAWERGCGGVRERCWGVESGWRQRRSLLRDSGLADGGEERRLGAAAESAAWVKGAWAGCRREDAGFPGGEGQQL
jgi:hypothetical protein